MLFAFTFGLCANSPFRCWGLVMAERKAKAARVPRVAVKRVLELRRRDGECCWLVRDRDGNLTEVCMTEKDFRRAFSMFIRDVSGESENVIPIKPKKPPTHR